MADRIQHRRDTEANWEAENPVLSAGEIGYVSDTDEAVIGDGSTAFTDLGRWWTGAAAAKFDMQTTSDAVNAAVTQTANSTKLTLNFGDPGGAVKLMVHGWGRVQSTSGTGNEAFCTVNVGGDRPAETNGVEFDASSSAKPVGVSHGREWTPGGAFTVTLELWASDGNVQHLGSGVTAMMVPA